MNLGVILEDFLFFYVLLFLTPVVIRQKQIALVAGLDHLPNKAIHDVTVDFGHFFLTDRPLHHITLTTSEQTISQVSFFDGREQVLAWADFKKFGSHSIF
jgi:hypothetical protein